MWCGRWNLHADQTSRGSERERESSVQENLNRLPRVPRPRTIQLIPIELSVESDHQSCPLMYDVMFTFCSENTLHPLNK